MKLHSHPVESTKRLFTEGVESHVEDLQKLYRKKLDEEYVKPNPFEGDISCTPLSEQ